MADGRIWYRTRKGLFNAEYPAIRLGDDWFGILVNQLRLTQATLTGDATTQDALNMANQGKLTITVSNIGGLLNGDTLTTFLSTAEYYITVGTNRYVFVPTTVTSSGTSITIAYTLKNSALAAELAAKLAGHTSTATAVVAGFSKESDNYTFADAYLPLIVIPGGPGLSHKYLFPHFSV